MKAIHKGACGGVVRGVKTTTEDLMIVGVSTGGLVLFKEIGDDYDVAEECWCEGCGEELRYNEIEMVEQD